MLYTSTGAAFCQCLVLYKVSAEITNGDELFESTESMCMENVINADDTVDSQ